MNYRQLEEAINKWTLELEEQEKIFLQQATQVNAWDRLLIDNGEKVSTRMKRCQYDHLNSWLSPALPKTTRAVLTTTALLDIDNEEKASGHVWNDTSVFSLRVDKSLTVWCHVPTA